MADVETKLRAGMARQGIHGAAAEEIVHAITSFALYGFPECVVGETRVVDADTGRWVAIEDVANGRVRLATTLACDGNMKIRKRRVLNATPSGLRMVYRVRTALGREIMATAEHPLLTSDGWRGVAALLQGDHIAGRRSHDIVPMEGDELDWDRVTGVEPVGERETYDLHIEGDHNFLANDLVVHNSHASSFALLAYASAYLKVHHPAAFYAALLNNQPMGFYHPATIIKDAQRHGLRILPIDIARSQWLCTVQPGEGKGSFARNPTRTEPLPSLSCTSHAVRLGLRYVRGLREAAARAIVRAREERPFASIHDLARRTGLERDELTTLSATGALAPLGGTRRASLWEAALLDPGELFEPPRGSGSPLAEMTEGERLVADYAGTGVTLGRHPMAMRRAELRRRGVLSARELALAENETRVRVAGSVIVRQRPGTAKGFVFLSLEDETGIANVIVTPQRFARSRVTLVTAPFLLVEGIVQKQDGVVSVRATRVESLSPLAHNVPSHDFG
jgi:DNA polymerase III alpha subunit